MLLPHSLLGGTALNATQMHKDAASEDRTHDLRIMRPTRYQLRYRRFCKRHALLNAEARLLRVTPARYARTGTQRCAASRRRATHIVMLCIDYATNVVEKAIRHRGDASDAATRALNTRTPWPMHFDVWVGPWDATKTKEKLLCGVTHFQPAECRSGYRVGLMIKRFLERSHVPPIIALHRAS